MIIRLSTTRQHGSNLHTINFQNNFPKFNLPGNLKSFNNTP
ncbi:hypothetical protein ES319_D07G053000v1 [Gossypium barbadense]|uniref:Uncharacterized protein n=1 Tax=Gossypium barbadense TaxID=3634 RepID=A0A5J5QMQ7_GOSBA|nr:hypothetical protein ES319_D07G053000v1 [Gossypium barbadense]